MKKKYDNLVFVIAGNRKEYKQYVGVLIGKPWVVRFDVASEDMAIIGTQKGKIVMIKYVENMKDIVSPFSRFGSQLENPAVEIALVGTYFKRPDVISGLKKIHQQHPDVRQKGVDIGIKI